MSRNTKKSRNDRTDSRVLLGADTPPLERWMTVGQGRTSVVGHGIVTEPGDDLGLAFYTEPMPGDFVLDLRFRLFDDDARSAVYVRMRDPRQDVPDRQDPSKTYSYGNPAYVPVDTGVEIEISGSDAGAIRGTATPREGTALRRGAWHDLRVEVRDQRYRSFLDGTARSELTNTDGYRGKPPEIDPASGFVGIRLDRGRVEFDRITVSPAGRGAAGRLRRIVSIVPRTATAAAGRAAGAVRWVASRAGRARRAA